MNTARSWFAGLWWLVACSPSTAVVGLERAQGSATAAALPLPGARNDALRAAAQHHGVPVELLMLLANHQGRFELPDVVDETGPVAGLEGAPAEVEPPPQTTPPSTGLEAPVDPESGLVLEPDPGDGPVETALRSDVEPHDPEAVSPNEAEAGVPGGDAHAEQRLFGLMHLTEAQVVLGAQLSGHGETAVRRELQANVGAAAAWLAQEAQRRGLSAQATLEDWAPVASAFLGANDDAEVEALALAELGEVLRAGFDLVTRDGERLAMKGTDGAGAAQQSLVVPGAYPPIQFIAAARSNYGGRGGGRPRFVVVHTLEGTMAGGIAVFKNPKRQASAHYIIRARDGHIVQMVTEGNNAWHCGHLYYNANSIGIEHEGFAGRARGGGYFTPKLYTSSAQLTCAIVRRYKIPVDRKHIFGHGNTPSLNSRLALCSDAAGNAGLCGGRSHHYDPGRYWDWTTYMRLVARCVSGKQIATAVATASPSTGVELRGTVRQPGSPPRAIAGATVRLGAQSAPTDAVGSFAFSSVPQGSQSLSVSASGFVTRNFTAKARPGGYSGRSLGGWGARAGVGPPRPVGGPAPSSFGARPRR